MAKAYETPIEIRPLEKGIRDFAYPNGYDTLTVFRDFLRYVVHGFSPGAPPLKDWKYPKEKNLLFFELLQKWVVIMSDQVERRGWYDAFGDLYMSLISRMTKQGRGQFFTPADICDLITAITCSQTEITGDVYDPCCGSGRLLLSFQAQKQGHFLSASDIDYTCCLMTVCNFVIHGCVGVVACEDTLRLDRFVTAWAVNETLNLTGIPTVREISEKEYSSLLRTGNALLRHQSSK